MHLEDGISLAQQEMEQKDATKMRKVGASMRFSMVSELRSRGETLDACSEVKVRPSCPKNWDPTQNLRKMRRFDTRS